MKQLIILLFIIFSTINLSAQDTLRLLVHFDTDKYELRENDKKLIRNFFLVHPPSTVSSIVLEGHTDHDASVEYNRTLSKNRAEAVRNHVLKHYQIPVSIDYDFHSELKPRFSNNNEEGKQGNRRVEVVVIKKGVEEIAMVEEEEPEQEMVGEPEVLADRDTTIVFANGIEMDIKAGTFDEAIRNKCVDAEFLPGVKEMMDAGLTTMTTGGEVLQTQGVFQIVVKKNNCSTLEKDCFGEPITLRIPANTCNGATPPSDMRLFSMAGDNRWNDEPMSNRMRLIKVDGQYFYEVKVLCPGPYNIDKKLVTWKFKVKVKNLAVHNVMIYDECCNIIIEQKFTKGNKAKLRVQCGIVECDPNIRVEFTARSGEIKTAEMLLSQTTTRKAIKRCPHWLVFWKKHHIPRKAVIFERDIEKYVISDKEESAPLVEQRN